MPDRDQSSGSPLTPTPTVSPPLPVWPELRPPCWPPPLPPRHLRPLTPWLLTCPHSQTPPRPPPELRLGRPPQQPGVRSPGSDARPILRPSPCHFLSAVSLRPRTQAGARPARRQPRPSPRLRTRPPPPPQSRRRWTCPTREVWSSGTWMLVSCSFAALSLAAAALPWLASEPPSASDS